MNRIAFDGRMQLDAKAEHMSQPHRVNYLPVVGAGATTIINSTAPQ